MYQTLEVTPGAVATTAHPPRPAVGDLKARVAGAGAITFALTVVAQNIIAVRRPPPTEPLARRSSRTTPTTGQSRSCSSPATC